MEDLNDSQYWLSDGGSSKHDLTGISVFLCSAVSAYIIQNHGTVIVQRFL